jgi:hypothetical protein
VHHKRLQVLDIPPLKLEVTVTGQMRFTLGNMRNRMLLVVSYEMHVRLPTGLTICYIPTSPRVINEHYKIHLMRDNKSFVNNTYLPFPKIDTVVHFNFQDSNHFDLLLFHKFGL